MLYFPTIEDKRQFELVTWPLPPGLLPWLGELGLGIYVLPEDKNRITEILFRRIGFVQDVIELDGRLRSETAFYQPGRKLIILPRKSLYHVGGECTVLHEIGHAVDFLYGLHFLDKGYSYIRLSNSKEFKRALRPNRPLNSYCKKKQKQLGDMTEQFACAFTAYFKEPEPDTWGNHVQQLSRAFITLMKRYIIEPFED